MRPTTPRPAAALIFGPVLLLGAVLLAGCGGAAEAPAGPVHVVAVGDVVCPPEEPTTAVTCQHEATADLTADLAPDVVLGLGDLQYESGSSAEFRDAWAASWGRFDDIIEPVPGNHEHETADAAGYRGYFGAGDSDVPRVRELGRWRVYLLDSSCEDVDCEAEASWLSQDLAEHPDTCTAIAMHHPRWSSGAHGPQIAVAPLWDAAVAGGVDLSLAAHDHLYERFAPMEETGHEDPSGVRHFVVGTGGKSFYRLRDPLRTESESALADHFGVLDLELGAEGYSWRFVDVAGDVLDQGSQACTS